MTVAYLSQRLFRWLSCSSWATCSWNLWTKCLVRGHISARFCSILIHIIKIVFIYILLKCMLLDKQIDSILSTQDNEYYISDIITCKLQLFCITICADYKRPYSKSSLILTLNEWKFNLSFSWVSLLFLKSWRVSVIPKYVTIRNPLTIQKRKVLALKKSSDWTSTHWVWAWVSF
jgi:hypothetical protein